VAFASTPDIEKRLGRSLDGSEAESVDFLLEGAQAVIEQAVDKTEEQIGDVPKVLRFMAVELVLRARSNPQGLASQSETLGAHSHTERFRGEGSSSDMLLTKIEERMVREAVYGQLSGTGQAKSLASDHRVLCRLAPASYRYDDCSCEGDCLCAATGS
jgi:hypothetical protein